MNVWACRYSLKTAVLDTCGYVAGLGWWGNHFGIVTNVDTHASARYGATGNQFEWHTVKMTFPESGKNQYWYDGELRATIEDGRRSNGKLRFMGCATGQFRNVKLSSTTTTTDPNSF